MGSSHCGRRHSRTAVNDYLFAIQMKVEVCRYWTREYVASQQDKVFLFGDNTYDRTKSHYVPSMTQAVIRGLPNAIGIDTKKNRYERYIKLKTISYGD